MTVQHRATSRISLLLCGLLGLITSPLAVQAQTQLLTNGNFETGTFSGWTLADQAGSGGSFFIGVPGADTPAVNGFSFATAPNALGGNSYAVSSSDSPGAHALLQNFTVLKPGEKVTLSFDMFVNDQSQIGPIVDASGLDYTTGGTFDDNQHARVDLLQVGAGDLSTAPADVLANFYLGVDNPGGGVPNPYQSYSFDISALVASGGIYRLRFAEVDNLSALNVGVDNVSVLAVAPTVPEPGSLMLVIGAALPLLVRITKSHLKRRTLR